MFTWDTGLNVHLLRILIIISQVSKEYFVQSRALFHHSRRMLICQKNCAHCDLGYGFSFAGFDTKVYCYGDTIQQFKESHYFDVHFILDSLRHLTSTNTSCSKLNGSGVLSTLFKRKKCSRDLAGPSIGPLGSIRKFIV